MNKTILICSMFLTGCSPFQELECIDGVVYTRVDNILVQSGLWMGTKCIQKGKP